MKLLVTGGSGFIGSNFIRYVLAHDANVSIINLDNGTYASQKNTSAAQGFGDLLPEERSRLDDKQGDICDHHLVDTLTKKVDMVINFAAETHVDRSILGARAFVRSNVDGLCNLLEKSLSNKIKRFVHISTDEVYGSCPDGSFTEETPLAPNNPYSATKAGADLLVRSFVKTYQFPSIIIRPSNNYGPWQFPEKAIPLFITNALLDLPLPVYGDGSNVREWLYVGDNCAGIYHVLNKGIIGEIYNLGGGRELSNIELVKKILSIMGKSEKLITFVKDRPGHDKRYSLDSSKVMRALGWSHQGSFDQKLKETIAWYIEHKSWWEAIRADTGRFANYYQTQYGQNIQS